MKKEMWKLMMGVAMALFSFSMASKRRRLYFLNP